MTCDMGDCVDDHLFKFIILSNDIDEMCRRDESDRILLNSVHTRNALLYCYLVID